VNIMAEPKIVVPISEYMREVRRFRTLREKRRKLYSLWGRYASLWRWYRRREDYERLVATIRAIWRNIREEREARVVFRRKVRLPYWRIEVAYMFRKSLPERRPPYLFYAEFRKTVFTRHPDRYAEFDPKTLKYIKPKPWMEEELREIMFATSVIARRRVDGTVAHADWLEELYKIRVFPFPDFGAYAIDEEEIEAPLDTQQYYVRIQKGVKEFYEYKTEEVREWLKSYRDWVRKMHEEKLIKYPELYMRKIRQTTIDEFVEWWEKLKRARRERR